MTAIYHSHYRGEVATFPAGKNDGNENQGLANYPTKVFKDSDDGGHYGKPVGVVTYQDGEFHCRITAQNRDWNFRALDLGVLQDQVRRFFGTERGRIRFQLDRAASLAKDGERAAILKV
jgi:hypothetical protein